MTRKTLVKIVKTKKQKEKNFGHLLLTELNYYFFLFQICDVDLKILNVNALYPGATHDAFIWNNSNVLPMMREINGNGKYYLIGKNNK